MKKNLEEILKHAQNRAKEKKLQRDNKRAARQKSPQAKRQRRNKHTQKNTSGIHRLAQRLRELWPPLNPPDYGKDYKFLEHFVRVIKKQHPHLTNPAIHKMAEDIVTGIRKDELPEYVQDLDVCQVLGKLAYHISENLSEYLP